MDKFVAGIRAGGTPALPGRNKLRKTLRRGKSLDSNAGAAPFLFDTQPSTFNTHPMSLPADYHMHTPLCRHATSGPGEKSSPLFVAKPTRTSL
jgi:hypothetical protein